MARVGRKRKIGVERLPSGQIKREPDGLSPALAKRITVLALSGYADPVYGTAPGVYFISGKINPEQYEAAKRFAELYRQYVGCLVGPQPPRSVNLERGAAQAPIDVDSDAGEREALRHVSVLGRYQDALLAVRGAGNGADNIVIRFCDGVGQSPTGYAELLLLRQGLSALSVLWKVKSK